MAFDNINLEKGLYSGGSFTKALSSIDPDENYRGTPLEKLDAFQRQLKRFDIKVGGGDSDTVEKFFSTQGSSVLFPEYVSRCVRAGLEGANILPDIVATVTNINANDYRSLCTDTTEDDKELKIVREGAFIPETSIKTKENIITLKKRGRTLVASYEAIKFQKLDVFSVALKQIGAQIGRTLLSDAVSVLINGDGNNNPAATISASSPLTYSDLVDFWNSFDPYELNTLVASPAMMAQILKLAELSDAVAGLDFHATGKPLTPFGAKLLKSAAVSGNKVIGLDKNYALEMIKCGDVMTEYDKLIDRQLDRAVISCTAGFAKLFNDSVKVLE